jgi:hypothetical protein
MYYRGHTALRLQPSPPSESQIGNYESWCGACASLTKAAEGSVHSRAFVLQALAMLDGAQEENVIYAGDMNWTNEDGPLPLPRGW